MCCKRKGRFIGLPDSVVNKTYDILEATATRLRLHGTNPDGTRTVVTLHAPALGPRPGKLLLTGGSSRTWMLDNTAEATIMVGTEANPTAYYAGGAAGQPARLPGRRRVHLHHGQRVHLQRQGRNLRGRRLRLPGPAHRHHALHVWAGHRHRAWRSSRSARRRRRSSALPMRPTAVYRILSIDDQHMVLRAGSGLNGGTGVSPSRCVC